ncbi:hypothetical protein [Oricola sp.]|uniref:hypothetical protein n=1 Tax=Oricola sp. TaxID=1979950 RepID=UPI0035190BA0
MEFNWRGAIDRNCDILCDIAFRLLVMAGIQAGRSNPTLPRHLYLRILAILRPAEFAARRLIAMAACKLVTITMRPTKERKSQPPNSVIPGFIPGTHSGEPETSSKIENEAKPSDISGSLQPHGVGPLVILGLNPSTTDGVLAKSPRRAVDAASSDTIPAFALFDPFKPFPEPWLTPAEIAALDNPDVRMFIPASPSNEPVDARPLGRRIRALANALMDLDGQALRLARWRARRAAGFGRPVRLSPFRPGLPPGWRKRPKTEVEEVLRECNYLGLEAWDTT